MTTTNKRCRAKKKEIKAIDRFRKKKKKNPDSEIPKCPEFEVKSKIGKLFMNEKTLEGYSVKILKLILIFMSITTKK